MSEIRQKYVRQYVVEFYLNLNVNAKFVKKKLFEPVSRIINPLLELRCQIWNTCTTKHNKQIYQHVSKKGNLDITIYDVHNDIDAKFLTLYF